ncbi:MAG: class I SAM-dependent methyltransferase [candidate division Zixibacteria bacterium]|nr:class I SAM-dependent methyltransferase [candidate division Zixibacteria bacterium]
MRILDLAPQLRHDERGIWRASRGTGVSYPDDGNQRCFEIEDASFWFNHRNDCIMALIHRFPPDGFILDVGGGNGYQAQRMIAEGFEAVLLEPGSVGSENARVKRGLPQVVCATLQDAGLLPESVPAIGLFDVLEHIPDDTAFIDLIHSVLRPDGLFYATVPAHPWLWSYADDMVHHCRRYREPELKKLLEGRFEVVYFSYYFQVLTLPLFLLRTLPHKIGWYRDRGVISNASEHGAGNGLLSRFTAYLLDNEVGLIRHGEEQINGPSVIFAARRL